MKVGIDISFARLNKAGIGSYIRGLLEGFSQVESTCEFYHFDVMQERDDTKPKSLRTYLDTLYRDLVWINFVIPEKVKRQRVDVLHMPVFYIPIIKPCKTVVTIHDTVWLDHPEYYPIWQRNYMKVFVPLAARNADAIITVSESARQDIITKMGVPQEKVHVTHLGISNRFSILPQSEVQRVKQKYGVEKYIFIVGSVEPRKNLERLFKAFAELGERFPDVILLHAGTAIWKSPYIFSLIDQLGLSGSIRFLWKVPQEDLIALYNGALFFILPSLYEGFGLPIIEAMACGCPVITSNISSMPEVAGDAAFLVNPYDTGEIKHAMGLFLENKNVRSEFALKGMDRAKHFSWNKCAQETIQVYRQVIMKKEDSKS